MNDIYYKILMYVDSTDGGSLLMLKKSALTPSFLKDIDSIKMTF